MRILACIIIACFTNSLAAQVTSADLKQECLERVLDSGDPQELMEKTARNMIRKSLKGEFKGQISNVRIQDFRFNRFKFDDVMELWKASKVEIDGYFKTRSGRRIDFSSTGKGLRFIVQFLRSPFGEIQGCSILISEFSQWNVSNAETNLNILMLDTSGPHREFKLSL